MVHLFVGVAWISCGPEISPYAYAPKPNSRAKRQHVWRHLLALVATTPLLNLLPHTLIECLHHLCFTIIIQTNPDANLVITWSRNPQSILKSDPGKPKKV